MAPINIAMGSPQAAALQEAVRLEMVKRGWVAEDENSVLPEYAVILLINNKSEEQVDSQMADITPDYDSTFTKWIFNMADEIVNAPQEDEHGTPPPTSPLAASSSPSAPNGTSTATLKRQASRSLSPNAKKARTGDVPLAPRAMRERRDGEKSSGPDRPRPSPRIDGPPRVRSLLDRVGPPVNNHGNDAVQARIDAITGLLPNNGIAQQSWQQAMNGPMPGMGMMDPNMSNTEMAQKFQEMMTMQMAMMQQMAMMNTPMGYMPGAVNMGMMPGQGQGGYERNGRGGRGRGRGRGNFNHNSHPFGQDNVVLTLPAPEPAPEVIEPPTATSSPEVRTASQPRPSQTVPVRAAPAPAPSKPLPTSTARPTVPALPAGPVTTQPGTLCKFELKCTNPMCPYAHPSPAATVPLVLSDELCPAGRDCKDTECTKVHPSPAKPQLAPKTAPTKVAAQGIMCRFGANCTRPGCVFAHPWDKSMSTTPCRYGAACTRVDCAFQHPPDRVLPSSFHAGLDESAPTIVKAPTAPKAAPVNGNATHISKNISQVFKTPNKSATPSQSSPSAEGGVTKSEAKETVQAAAGAAATLESAVKTVKEAVGKVEDDLKPVKEEVAV